MFYLQTILAMLGILIGYLVVIVPVIIAYRRQHPQRQAIAILTVLLGWIPVVWLVALIWALKQQPKSYAR